MTEEDYIQDFAQVIIDFIKLQKDKGRKTIYESELNALFGIDHPEGKPDKEMHIDSISIKDLSVRVEEIDNDNVIEFSKYKH